MVPADQASASHAEPVCHYLAPPTSATVISESTFSVRDNDDGPEFGDYPGMTVCLRGTDFAIGQT